MTNLGNDVGDDFGKCSLESGKSMNRFLGDEFGKKRVFIKFEELILCISSSTGSRRGRKKPLIEEKNCVSVQCIEQ